MSQTTKYAKDTTGNEEYPLNQGGLQTVVENRYARDKNKNPYYPRNAAGDEVMNDLLGLIQRFGEYVYPLKKTGRPNYREVQNKQVYEQVDGEWLIGKGIDGHEYYAKDETNNEYYPEGKFARKADGSIYYAEDMNGITVFPKKINQDEFYPTLVNTLKAHTIPKKYAKEASGDEIYPRAETLDGSEREVMLNRMYAKRKGVAYYPKDGNNNEYYLDPAALNDKVLANYAITNDGKVILPGISGVATTKPGLLPAVAPDQILGELYREKDVLSKDFLTAVDATVKPATMPFPMRYGYRNKLTNIMEMVVPPGAPAAASSSSSSSTGCRTTAAIPMYKTWYFWILMLVAFIVKSFVMWWFVFRGDRSRVP